MKINTESVFNVTLTGIVAFLVERIANQDKVDLSTGLFLATSITIIALFFTEFFSYLYRLNKFERRIEGDWININSSESMSDEPFKYALVKIIYDGINKKIKYLGYAFDSDINFVGEFSSISVDVDSRNMSFDYIYDGRIVHKKLDSAKGMGEVRFSPVAKGKYQFATGQFRGVGSEFKPVYHRMAKIPDDFLKGIIDKKSTISREDMVIILKSFKDNHESFSMNKNKNTALKNDGMLSSN